MIKNKTRRRSGLKMSMHDLNNLDSVFKVLNDNTGVFDKYDKNSAIEALNDHAKTAKKESITMILEILMILSKSNYIKWKITAKKALRKILQRADIDELLEKEKPRILEVIND
jgi:hypothetical protein